MHDLTDAQRQDLAGPVRSVSVTTTQTDVVWPALIGPSLIIPVWCRECEFDPEGSLVKSGRTFDGSFIGGIIRIVRDANGHVTERIEEDASTGEMYRHEYVGTFGDTEECWYLHGELQFRTINSYDEYGHKIYTLSLDGAGNQLGRAISSTDKDGNNTEEWDWGKDGELRLHFLHTFDPKSNFEQFTSFDEFGGSKLKWTVTNGRLSSFWQPSDVPVQFGDRFTEYPGDNTSEYYDCHSGGTCDLSRVHSVYLDPPHHNPVSVEWRDETGNLRFAAYYEYEVDAYRNWTHRQIWVWSTELGERKLYETDHRSISYWPQ